MRSKNSKRRFLLVIGRESQQRAWTAQEFVHKTSLATTSLKTVTAMDLIEPTMKRKKQKLQRNLLRRKRRMMSD